MNVCVQTVKALATVMAPFMPFSARQCAGMLQLEQDPLPWDQAADELPAGHPLGKPVIMYRKLDPVDLFGKGD
jgi:methionyl-tRNA synthetase